MECMYVRTYGCTRVCVYIYIYIYMCVCVCVYVCKYVGKVGLCIMTLRTMWKCEESFKLLPLNPEGNDTYYLLAMWLRGPHSSSILRGKLHLPKNETGPTGIQNLMMFWYVSMFKIS